MTTFSSRAALFLSAAFAASVGLAAEPFPSTYQVPSSPALLIQGAVVLTGTGERIDDADMLIENGRITAVGRGLSAPAGARILNAKGRWVTPGIIDIHSHLGVYASPATRGLDDGNEATNPVTANVWAEHSIWPEDPGFETALEGGVTTLQILPGSANLIGGRSAIVKNVPAVTYQAMKFPGAAVRPENGLRRESQARVRREESGPFHPHGQCRRLSAGLRRCPGLSAAVGQVPTRGGRVR